MKLKLLPMVSVFGAAGIFLSGCGQQALTQLKPTTEKQRIAIVYQGDSTTMQDVHSMISDQVHGSKHTFEDFGMPSLTQVDQTFQQKMQSKQYQWIATNASASMMQSISGSKLSNVAWIPDFSTSLTNTSSSLPKPAVTVNANDVAYVDGYMAGLLPNRTDISVVVPNMTGQSSQSVSWVVSGIRHAGFAGRVSVVDLSKVVTTPTTNPASGGHSQTGSATGASGSLGASGSSTQPNTNKSSTTDIAQEASLLPTLTSQVLIFPVPVDDRILASAYGKLVVLGYPTTSTFAGIVADVKPVFAESLQSLLQAWNQSKWQPGQTLTIFPGNVIRLHSGTTGSSSVNRSQVQTLVQSIADQSFKPTLDRTQ